MVTSLQLLLYTAIDLWNLLIKFPYLPSTEYFPRFSQIIQRLKKRKDRSVPPIRSNKISRCLESVIVITK